MHNLREKTWQVQGVEWGFRGEKSFSATDGWEPFSQRGERERGREQCIGFTEEKHSSQTTDQGIVKNWILQVFANNGAEILSFWKFAPFTEVDPGRESCYCGEVEEAWELTAWCGNPLGCIGIESSPSLSAFRGVYIASSRTKDMAGTLESIEQQGTETHAKGN